jgi:hypothetical protein
LVFYAPNHVAISVGNGNVVTTTGRENERLPVAIKMTQWLAGYRGWAMPG